MRDGCPGKELICGCPPGMCGYGFDIPANARQIDAKSIPDQNHMRTAKTIKNNTSEPEQPPKIYDNLELSPLAAEVLRNLHFWKRRTITDLVHGHGLRHSSRTSITRQVRKLMRDGLVRQHGKGRETWYTL